MTDTTEQNAEPARIRVHGLEKSFGDHKVLRGIDFESRRGTSTVLLGPSGSGKTTVLRSLNVLETPERGVIGDRRRRGRLLPLPPGKAGRRESSRLRAQSGMVFQAHNLFPHRTVLENIIEGPVVAQRRPARGGRRRREGPAGPGGPRRPGATPTRSSSPAASSSASGIARALALKPRVVLFDEPTSALDPELVGEVLAVIKDLAAQGWTTVIVTHEIRFAEQVADQVLFLDGGVIVEQGPSAQVIGDPREERTRRFLKRILDPG